MSWAKSAWNRGARPRYSQIRRTRRRRTGGPRSRGGSRGQCRSCKSVAEVMSERKGGNSNVKLGKYRWPSPNSQAAAWVTGNSSGASYAQSASFKLTCCTLAAYGQSPSNSTEEQ